MPRLASCTSLTLPSERVRTALPLLVAWSTLALGVGVVIAGWLVGGGITRGAGVVVVRGVMAFVVRGSEVVVIRGDEVVVVRGAVVYVVPAPPPGFPAGLGAGAAGLGAGAAAGAGLAGAGAGFLLFWAAPDMPPIPIATARIAVAETFLTFLQIVIEILIPALDEHPNSCARRCYSTLLTLPSVKVTFMSLK